MRTGVQARAPEGIMPAFTRRLPDLLFDTKLIESGIGGERARRNSRCAYGSESSKSQGVGMSMHTSLQSTILPRDLTLSYRARDDHWAYLLPRA
jgi:hypothetical protein